MEISELQTIGHKVALYVSFVGSLSAVKLHKRFMKPSGEDIDHWTSFIYDFGDHIYHLLHASTDIVIQIVLFGLFLRMSWKIVTSELRRSDGSHPSGLREHSDS